LSSTVHDPQRTELAVRRMVERRVDGVAVLTFGMEEKLIEHLRSRKVPLVFVDVGPDVPGVRNIRVNYLNGIRQAVQHLAALRHVRIAFVTGPMHLKSSLARKAAFEQAMKEIGLEVPPEFIMAGDHTVEGGVQALAKLTALPNAPSAVMCSNDLTAIGVLRQAYDLGIATPRDLSVIGFDDIKLAQFAIPPLTTVQMSQAELSKLAFKALINEVEGPGTSPPDRDYILITSLVLRNSTAMASSRS
jgi:DNA-binding LacI/PurR family transcriptional regulator